MKCRYLNIRVCVLTVLLRHSICETEASALRDKLLETYKSNLKTAIAVEKSEKISTKNVTDEFAINLVKKMTHYRLEITIHRNHSFSLDSNEKWLQCVDSKREQIKQIEEAYSQGERECLNNAQIALMSKKLSLKVIVKQIHDWREGYKYLQNLCKEDNMITKNNAGKCLIEYMQEDNYSSTVERLIELFNITQAELETEAEQSLINFEVCLRSEFSTYLSGLRGIRGVINKCYKRNNVVRSGPNNAIGCISLFKLNCIPL